MRKRDVVVFGMGKFGESVAKQLEANGCKVLAVDSDEEKVRQISEYVTLAMCANSTDEEALDELGINNFDTAIVAIGHNMEGTILTIMYCKEHGVKRVIAKALDELQGKVYAKVGADEVIYPEYEMGKRLANNLTMSNIVNAIEVADDFSMGEIPVPESWVGKDLKTLQLREKHHITVIAVRRGKKDIVNPFADEQMKENDTLVVLGSNESLKKLTNKKK